MTIPAKYEKAALIAALIGMTVLCVALLMGQESAQADRDDYRYQLTEATSRPMPTRTVVETKTPPPPPPKTVVKTVTVTKTIEVERPAERASRSVSRTSTSGLNAWKQRYWDEAQEWATWPKTRAVIMCESTDRVKAVSATGKYRGLYQIDRDFWASYGGLELASRPDLATRAEQNYVAYRGYVSRGWSPWSCA